MEHDECHATFSIALLENPKINFKVLTLCLLRMPTESYRINSIHTNVGLYYTNKESFTYVKFYLFNVLHRPLTPRRAPKHPMCMRLGGPHSWSGRVWRSENLLPHTRIRSRCTLDGSVFEPQQG
jgi:hypothetical protein